jgi:hypothetical protein
VRKTEHCTGARKTISAKPGAVDDHARLK